MTQTPFPFRSMAMSSPLSSLSILCVFFLVLADASFVVEDETIGTGVDALNLKVLKNSETGEYVEVVWDLGGKTEALMLKSKKDGSLRPVLLDHDKNATAIKENVGWRGAMLIPYANRIANGTYTLNGKTYYMERNEDRGKYGKIGLHGYLYKYPMKVLASSGGNTLASLVLGYEFTGKDAGYPFHLKVELTYVLDTEGFTVNTKVTNTEQHQPLPFFNGWHSYFKVSSIATATVQLDPCSKWNHIDVPNDNPINSSLIPTGLTTPFTTFDGSKPLGGTTENPTYYDDEFKAIAPVDECPQLKTRITDGKTKDTAVLWQSKGSRFVQVYSGTMFSQGKQAIAVEAMSSEADAWNNMQGVNILQAGEVWEGKFGVYLE